MMSDPGTNIEIEDVLSSIRRLVSQDAAVRHRPMPHRTAPAEHAVVLEDEAPTLVLTPAQRVSEEDAAVEEPSCADAPATPELEATCEEVTAADAEETYEGEVIFDDDTAFPPAPETQVDLGEELNRLEDTIAEMEAAVAQSGAEFEPEQGDPFAPDEGAALADQFDAQSESHDDAQDAAPEMPVEAEAQDAEAPQADDAHEPFAAEAQDEEVELFDPELAEAQEALVDPDLESDAWAGDAEDWSEEPAPAATDPLASAVTGKVLRRLHLHDAEEQVLNSNARASSYERLREDIALEEASENILRDENVMAPALDKLPISEEALRDLVADMIREELQGALGERITRNVRKLVRREIQRALVSREFE